MCLLILIGRRLDQNKEKMLYSVAVFKVYNFGPMAQLVRALPCHGRGRGFESRLGR